MNKYKEYLFENDCNGEEKVTRNKRTKTDYTRGKKEEEQKKI
jgi:hypothetical protein